MVQAKNKGTTMPLESLDHYNISTNDLKACRRFYCKGLGLEDGFRPRFGIPGLWLYLEGRPVVHIIGFDEDVGTGSGTVDHVAFRGSRYDQFVARLDDNGIEYEARPVPDMDLYQLFCFDPHGIKVEVNFFGMDRPWKVIAAEHKAMNSARAAKKARAAAKSKSKPKSKTAARARA